MQYQTGSTRQKNLALDFRSDFLVRVYENKAIKSKPYDFLDQSYPPLQTLHLNPNSPIVTGIEQHANRFQVVIKAIKSKPYDFLDQSYPPLQTLTPP